MFPSSSQHSSTVDSTKLEYGPGTIHASCPCFLLWGWRIVIFQFSGFYRTPPQAHEAEALEPGRRPGHVPGVSELSGSENSGALEV